MDSFIRIIKKLDPKELKKKALLVITKSKKKVKSEQK
jgi:hypothetical protein